MSIRITSPGPLTTVQDMGRLGHMKDGFSACGVMDKFSAATANAICSNEAGCAVLEMTMLGISAEFLDRTYFALAGADMNATLRGEKIDNCKRYEALPGDVLKMSAAVSGCRCYMAVSGGFDVQPFLGSRSTDIKCAVGGFHGRKLAAGDILPVAPKAPPRGNTAFADMHLSKNGETVKVRAVPGPQDTAFTDKAMSDFFSEEYEVTDKSDRMGMRLSGVPLESVNGTDIMSDGIAEGSVQVPGGGQPIVLMADRQTTGGYAKIATVIGADLPLLAQARPGDKIRFVRCTVEKAASALAKQRAQTEKLLKKTM